MRIEENSVTVENAADVKRTLAQAWLAGERAFDFSGVTHVDSAALALVTALVRRARDAGEDVALTGLPSGLRSLAELYGVDELLRDYLPAAGH